MEETKDRLTATANQHPNGKTPGTIQPQTPQEKLNQFLKDNQLGLVVYVISPRTQTPVPVIEFLQPGWEQIAIQAVEKRGDSV